MVATTTMLVLSVGLSILAGKLLAKKNKAIAQDDKPTTLATRGTYLPRIVGRRRVGAVWGWAGDRFKKKENAGKKGSTLKPEVDIWRESGWHQLAVGPGAVLWTIEQNGEFIFTGPITPNTHPSGSTVDLGNEGSFRIFWGEVDQPTNSYLGDASRVGVTSSWPHCFYIEWTAKRLSQQPVWPLLTYDIECQPGESHLSNTPAYMTPTFALDGQTHSVESVVNGAQGTGKFVFDGDVFASFNSVGRVRSIGDTGISPDQDFDVWSLSTRLQAGVPKTDLFPVGGLAGATGDGSVQAYSSGQDDGYNLAHILADLWFSAWPHGIGQNQADFDMDSLEDLGTLLVTEGIKGSVLMKDGQSLRSVMGSIHQDLGVMLPIDFSSGLLKFQPVRAPTAAVPNLTEDVLLKLPETEINHAEAPVDRLIFSFTDRENFHREMTIGIDDAGQATFQEYFRSRTVPIESTINFGSANTIAERRSQEELAGAAVQKLIASRGARILLPGTQVTAAGVAETLLITSVEIDPLSGRVTLNCIPDYLAADQSSFVQFKATIASPAQTVEPALQFQPVELPEWLSGPEQRVMIARIRAHAQIEGGEVYISRDDTTFTSKGTDTTIMQGGTLTSELVLDSLFELDEGPTFDALGPDIASVLDLSADVDSWRSGRQLVLINNEIFYLKKVTSLGGDSYRLDGLIRARYDTRRELHSIGSEVYIAQNDDGLPVSDVLIVPEVTLYTKSQAVGRGVANLAVIPSESLELYGKGVRPPAPAEVRFDTLPGLAGVTASTWKGSLTTDLPITWGFFTPRTINVGAGFAGAGVPQGTPVPEGDFSVEILDSGDVVVRSLTVSTNAYEYTETDRLADFSSSEPATFKVRVTQLRDGLASDPTTTIFTRT